jgi:PAS domain S-box-containing protein
MVTEVVDYLLKIGVSSDQFIMQEFYHLSVERGALSEGEGLLGAHELLTFKQAAHSSYNHIVITSIDGVILYANPAAERMTGFSVREMEGHTPRLWGSLTNHGVYKNLWHTIKTKRQPFIYEIQNHRKNGELYFAKMTISPIINEKGILLGFESTEEDITSRKALEENLKERNETLEKINSYMVNREIKMIALKEENERLKKELEQYTSGQDNQKKEAGI